MIESLPASESITQPYYIYSTKRTVANKNYIIQSQYPQHFPRSPA